MTEAEAVEFLAMALAETVYKYRQPLLEPIEVALMKVESQNPAYIADMCETFGCPDLAGIALVIAEGWWQENTRRKQRKEEQDDEKKEGE